MESKLLTLFTVGSLPAALTGLAAFKRPKRSVALADWPRNAQGKLNRAAFGAAAVASLARADPRR